MPSAAARAATAAELVETGPSEPGKRRLSGLLGLLCVSLPSRGDEDGRPGSNGGDPAFTLLLGPGLETGVGGERGEEGWLPSRSELRRGRFDSEIKENGNH